MKLPAKEALVSLSARVSETHKDTHRFARE